VGADDGPVEEFVVLGATGEPDQNFAAMLPGSNALVDDQRRTPPSSVNTCHRPPLQDPCTRSKWGVTPRAPARTTPRETSASTSWCAEKLQSEVLLHGRQLQHGCHLPGTDGSRVFAVHHAAGAEARSGRPPRLAARPA
jgi:hypothetical protein